MTFQLISRDYLESEFELHLLNLASPLIFQKMLYNTYLDTFDVHHQYYILDMEQLVGHT